MPKPNLVSLNQCSQIFGVSRKALTAYIENESMPVVLNSTQGKATKVDTVAVHEWLTAKLLGKGSPMAEAVLGKVQAERKRIEIANATTCSKLFLADEVSGCFSEVLIELRRSFEGLAGRCSGGNRKLRAELLQGHRAVLKTATYKLGKYMDKEAMKNNERFELSDY